MKHNIFTLSLGFVLISSMFLACTDYTDDIQTPQAGSSAAAQSGSVVGDSALPAHLQKPNDGEFSEEKMLVNIGLNVIVKNVDEFYVEARRLKRDVSSRCEKLNQGLNDESHLLRVQEQWKKTMLAYHRLDAIEVGPLADNGSRLAGEIYSWPFVNTCGIDMEVARLPKNTGSQVLPTNRKGLAALEYLLFSSVEKTVCNPTVINKDAVEWEKKSDIEKQKDRCAYEMRLVDDLETQSAFLFQEWTTKNFTKKLIDGSLFPDIKTAVNNLSDALFAMEFIKDTKLGMPLGLIKGCDDVSGLCAAKTEHIWSGLALEGIEVQVATFKEAFFGSSDYNVRAFGFDDFLLSKGHTSTVEDFKSSIAKIEGSLLQAQTVAPLFDLVTSTDKSLCTSVDHPQIETQPACVVYYDMRRLVNLMKTDLLTLLSLQAPAAFQGDND